MKFRGPLSIAALSASVALSAAVLFDVAALKNTQNGPMFSLAPLSLGNPAAAATLQTRRIAPVGYEQGDAFASQAPAVAVPYAKTVKVKPGNTLSGLLINAGLARIEAAKVVTAFSKAFDPRRIKAGQSLVLEFTAESPEQTKKFQGLTFETSARSAVHLTREGDDFKAVEQEKVLHAQLRRASGRIDDSLYMAGKRADLPVAVLNEMIRAYSWDVDFQRSIRKGDAFSVLYEALENTDGKTVAYGNILFAELVLSGDSLPIYRFSTSKGIVDYFDDKGRSAKKTLLRTPIDGARLSSGFGNRKHPVLGYNKMHKGVDFAAARGTPIFAGGDGMIDYAGRKGAYGKYVRIRHNGEYTTAYAHMKGFAKGIGAGKRIRQGQIIGYVGTTGRSTGPHLHYEILKNGVQVNPMKVKMPSGQKLKGGELARFQDIARRYADQFADLGTGETSVAQNAD